MMTAVVTQIKTTF